ncbi:hypothetical protein [Methylobacterium sp. ID0610]|uniref:hypothetical protein n=1 Tax=Methylobacterium carpenticola TaxID=3344827 RepID=UPI003693C338
MAVLLAIGLSPGALAQKAKPAPRRTAEPVLTCLALANLRILLHDTKGDPALVAALFAQPQADHLGCAMTPADRIAGVDDRVTIGGTPYLCLKVKDSSVCRWTEER